MSIGTSSAYARALAENPDLGLTEEEFYDILGKIMMGELPTNILSLNRGLSFDNDGKLGMAIGQPGMTVLTAN